MYHEQLLSLSFLNKSTFMSPYLFIYLFMHSFTFWD